MLEIDQMVLADLLESAFNGEVESQLRPTGRPKKNRGPSVRFGGAQVLQLLEGDR